MKADLLKSLRLLGDENRLRMLRLLSVEELSVAELQDILGLGQSRISMALAQLKAAGLIELRRAGQKSLYRMTDELPDVIRQVLSAASREVAAMRQDDRALTVVLRKRKDRLRDYFDELAGRFGRDYVPGRSWKGLAEMLLTLLPPLTVADLGAGEGTVSLLLAQRAQRVIAVDSSPKMCEYATEVARRNGVANLDYRLGDLEQLPLADGEVDLALFHQSLHHAMHPDAALAEARRVVKPGGRIIILDLLRHRFEQAREMYADVWLGFTQVELEDLLLGAGLTDIAVSVVHREDEAPHFETVLATGRIAAGDDLRASTPSAATAVVSSARRSGA